MHLSLLGLLLAAASFPASAFAQGGAQPEWRATNPGAGGYFMRIGSGPSGIMVACSDLSGPYRSLDRGRTWEPIGPDRGITHTHAASVAFHAVNPALIYLGSGGGLFRSRDFGETFDKVIPDGYLEHVAIAPSNELVAYAAYHPAHDSSEGEVHKTVDGGDTWQQVDLDLPAGRRILKLLVLPSDSDTLYVQTGNGRFASGPRNVYRSDDGGITYTAIGDSFADLVVDVALDPHDEDGLYVSVDDPSVFHLGYLHKSSDRGATWTYLDQRGGFIWPHASDPQTIRMIQCRYQYSWLPGEGIWESTQGGLAGSWTKKSSVSEWTGGWSTAYWAFNAASNHGAVSMDLSDPDTVLWAGSQFAYASFDGGQSAEALFCDEVGGVGSNAWRSRGLDNVVIFDLAINESNPSEIYAGFYDLGTWCSLDGGASWLPRNDVNATGNWAGAGGNTYALETDPLRPGVVWSSQAASKGSPAVLLRSTDSGATWPIVSTGLPATPLIGLSLDRSSSTSSRTLYITADGDVYGSDDDGLSWTLRLSQGGMRFTAVDRHDGNIVYAGGEGGLWRSMSAGAPGTFVEVGLAEMGGSVSGMPTEWRWVGVFDIVSDPAVPGRIYVSVHGEGKGLYRSSDNGTTWEAQRLLDDDHLRCVAVDPADSNKLYATSSSPLAAGGYSSDSKGVWFSADAGANWTQQNDGLTWPFAIPIALGPAGSGMVFLGSPGTGIHRLETPTLAAAPKALSGATGGTIQLALAAGTANAGRGYLVAAGGSGVWPGSTFAGLAVPLNFDLLTVLSIQEANTPAFVNTLGLFDANGEATSTIHVPPQGLSPLIGREVAFAYVTLGPIDFVSEAARVTIVL